VNGADSSNSASGSTSRRLRVFDTPARKIDAVVVDHDGDDDKGTKSSDDDSGTVHNANAKAGTTRTTTTTTDATTDTTDEYTSIITQRRQKNVLVGVLSVVLAISNYAWQWTHPVTPIQLLFEMQQASAPIKVVGNTDKPTVIDFWAPWYVCVCVFVFVFCFFVNACVRDFVNACVLL